MLKSVRRRTARTSAGAATWRMGPARSCPRAPLARPKVAPSATWDAFGLASWRAGDLRLSWPLRGLLALGTASAGDGGAAGRAQLVAPLAHGGGFLRRGHGLRPLAVAAGSSQALPQRRRP